MKKSLLLLFFVTLAISAFAQITTSTVYNATPKNERFITFDGYNNHRVYGTTSEWVSVMETRIDDIYRSMKEPVYAPGYQPKPNDRPGKWVPKTPMVLGVVYAIENNKYPPRYTVPSLSKSYTGYMLAEENSVIEVVGAGINKSNLSDYRFRVIDNDSVELISWRTPELQQKHGAKHPYGYFGQFYSLGKELTVEVVNIKNYNIRDGIVLNWRNHLRPVINGVVGYRKGKGADALKLQFKAPITLNADTLAAVNISLKDHQTLPYDIYWVMSSSKYRAGTDTVLLQSGLRENFFSLSNQYFTTQGSYKLLIYPVGTKDKNREAGLAFNVDTSMGYKKGYTILQILPYFLLALLAFCIYYLYNKRKVRNIKRQKETANLKLGSVRAQLNPHFMFNALTSIQNLMHQQDTAEANHYLSKFADLTRQVLNATTTELISLEDELRIIEDYLQIEQLRFGFAYNVEVDKGINIANTELPGMLMQPFIENAAKHGVSNKRDKGKINISIAKQQSNLTLIIADNGGGFDTQSNSTNGFGLKIGRERVALLNQLYKDQPITLQINSDANGTKITITLSHWLQ